MSFPGFSDGVTLLIMAIFS